MPASAQEAPDEGTRGGPTSSWQVLLGLAGGYDTNIEFQTPDDPGDGGLWGWALVTRKSRSPRGQFSLSLEGGGVRYQDQTQANRAEGSVALGTSYRLSPRATLSFNADGSYGDTGRARSLIAAGIQLPRSQVLDYGGGFGLELKPGERTTLELTARYRRVDFEAPELLDTEGASAGLSLSQRLSTRSTLALTYDFLRTNDLRDGFDSHEAALRWSRALARRLTLSLAAGPGYAIEPRGDGSRTERWYYYGRAGLEGRIRRSTLGLRLRRSTNPAYGLGGNRLSYGAGLDARIPIGRRVYFYLDGVHTWSEDPTGLDSVPKFVSDDATASFTYTFLRRLGLSLGYWFRRYDPEGGRAVVSHRGSFGLTWTYNRP